MAEYNGAGTFQRRFVYGNYIDEPLVMSDGSNDYYYAQDHLYSSAALLDSSGGVVERYEYDAYGQPYIMDADYGERNASQFGNPYMFTGRDVDLLDNGNLKLQYNRNRYYEYYIGRWLTQDPLGITPNVAKPNVFDITRQYKDGLNLYEYLMSQPIISKDAYGLYGSAGRCPQDKCDSWEFMPYRVMNAGAILGVHMVNAYIEADAFKCCFSDRSKQKSLYKYFGVGMGLGIKFSFTTSSDSIKLQTNKCVSLKDWEGGGSLITYGIGLGFGAGIASFETPLVQFQMPGFYDITEKEFTIEASFMATKGQWWTKSLPKDWL